MSVAALAVFLREELSRQNMTQEQLAETTGIPDSTLSRILNGTVGEPRASQIAKIGKALKIDFWCSCAKLVLGMGRPLAQMKRRKRSRHSWHAIQAWRTSCASHHGLTRQIGRRSARMPRCCSTSKGGLDEPQAPQGSE